MFKMPHGKGRKGRYGMSKLVLINAKLPICPECLSKMQINLVNETIKCYRCKSSYKIIELGKNDRDFICEVKDEKAKIPTFKV